MEPKLSEWEKFCVGEPSDNPSWPNDDCAPFDTVSHVSHLEPALKIMQDKRIRAGLVFDESVLNTERILVSWTSPNYWTPGFRYGNVRFQFGWAEKVREKKYYWVESMAYGVKACRILITTNTHEKLAPYDPTHGDGPWWFDTDSGTHYFNGDYCLEFMFEHDLACDEEVRVDFVKHHERNCSTVPKNPESCPQLGMSDTDASSMFVAGMLGRAVQVTPLWFSHDHGEDVPYQINRAWTFLQPRLASPRYGEYEGEMTGASDGTVAVARAICNAFYLGENEEASALRTMFADKESFTEGLGRLLAQHLGIPDWGMLGKW